MIRTAKFLKAQYPGTLKAAEQEMSARDWACIVSLMSYGMTEAEFIRHAVSIEISKRVALMESLCQIMFDPENQPPQYSIEQAWQHFAGDSAMTSSKEGANK